MKVIYLLIVVVGPYLDYVYLRNVIEVQHSARSSFFSKSLSKKPEVINLFLIPQNKIEVLRL